MDSDHQVLSGELVRIYRTLPSRILGWVLVVGAAGLAVLTVIDLVAGRREEGILWPLALVTGLAVGAWVLFLRPHARLYTDGVMLANVIADVQVPFDRVTDVTHQWALELHDDQGRKHSAWAVPVRRDIVRRKPVDDYAEALQNKGAAGVTAQGVADEVHRYLQRWKLAGGQQPQSTVPDPVATICWPSVVLLAIAAALVVLALLS